MPRRAKSRRLLKAEQRFKSTVTDYLLSLGARPGRWYDYELDTPAGLLHLTPYENWLACRFDDVAFGRAFTATCGHSCNPYSGKWNHHFLGGVEVLHPDRVLPQLRHYFGALMTWKRDA